MTGTDTLYLRFEDYARVALDLRQSATLMPAAKGNVYRQAADELEAIGRRLLDDEKDE